MGQGLNPLSHVLESQPPAVAVIDAAQGQLQAFPPTFQLFPDRFDMNFNNIFGDRNNVMTYMVNYLTNTTDAPLLARVSLKPDDSAEVKLDNTVVYYYDGCCSFREFPMVIPPGEHRFMEFEIDAEAEV